MEPFVIRCMISPDTELPLASVRSRFQDAFCLAAATVQGTPNEERGPDSY